MNDHCESPGNQINGEDCSYDSPSPRPSPAGRGRIVRWFSKCCESAVAGWPSVNQATADFCFPLPAGEGLRVRESRTVKSRVRIADRGESKTPSPSPRPSPARRGRIILSLFDCLEAVVKWPSAIQASDDCCSLSRRERVRVREIAASNHKLRALALSSQTSHISTTPQP
jgi:hypothetical protein